MTIDENGPSRKRPQEAAERQAARVRLVAFYLPQYHPIPENDRWWGQGFTDWSSVAKATPAFRGHYQPHLPAELGFYDLRVPEVRRAQADLAREHGIYGFCYYHYWFHGKRLLEGPFNEVLDSGEPAFPFCLCWANESWTRRWDGRNRDILINQTYSDDDDKKHIEWLARAFGDSRYMRINGKPVFLVYRADSLPDPLRTTDKWRKHAQHLGIGDLYLCRVDSFAVKRRDPTVIGFDAAVDFQPDGAAIKVPLSTWIRWSALKLLGRDHYLVVDYPSYAKKTQQRRPVAYKRFPCVTPSWDNRARRKVGATIFCRSSPSQYETWLTRVVRRFTPYSTEENLVFINAWNEWAEGNHLEPCQRWGRAYLEATRRVFGGRAPGMDE